MTRESTERILNLDNASFVLYARLFSPRSSLPYRFLCSLCHIVMPDTIFREQTFVTSAFMLVKGHRPDRGEFKLVLRAKKNG